MKLASLFAILTALWFAVFTMAATVADEDAATRSRVDNCLFAGHSLADCGGYR